MTADRNGPGALAGATEAGIGYAEQRSDTPNRAAGQRRPADFRRINRAGLARLPDLLARWLPGGRIEGTEYVALNPRRADHQPGSFKINLATGQWADFAVAGARGGDVVSLAAYLGDIGQTEAAERLAAMLGIGAHHAR